MTMTTRTGNKERMKLLVMVDQASGQLMSAGDDPAAPEVIGVEWHAAVEKALGTVREQGCEVAVGLAARNEQPSDLDGGPGHMFEALYGDGDAPLLDGVRRWCAAHKGEHIGVVCADGLVRHCAQQAGAKAFAHPLLAAWHTAGLPVQLLLVRTGQHLLARLPEALCYTLRTAADGRREALLAVPDTALAWLVERGAEVTKLPEEALSSDLKILRGPWESGHGVKDLPPTSVLASFSNGDLLVAVEPGKDAAAFSLHGAHGHDELLLPQSLAELLRPSSLPDRADPILDRLPREVFERVELPPWLLWPRLGCPASADGYRRILDRYTGVADLDADGPIVSRHSSHPDNARAVNALVAELRDMGYCVHTHAFIHGGRTLHNVIADLPGAGYWILKEAAMKPLRALLQRPWSKEPLPRTIKEFIGNITAEDDDFPEFLPPTRPAIIARLKQKLRVGPWFPYWRRCLLRWPGLGSRIVIVGCHLDSTAQSSAGYNATTDPAPGRDDDGSGLAAVLAIAKQFTALRGCLRHTVRFCFFNAEEQGLVGSKAYAAMLKAANAPVKAAVCLDMIGYNSDVQRLFEVHAGYTDASVRDASVPVAERIAHWADVQGRLAPAQVYKGTATSAAPPNGTNRDVVDGAINRSDHAAFHQQGWPAVVVTEDFFANTAAEPASDPNPNYHRTSDTTVDHAFAADIVCAVARAVRELAGG